MMELLGLTAAVAGILFLSWYLTKKLGALYGFQRIQSRNLEVLDRISLGQNEAAAVVRAGKSYLLLGISPAGITCLRELKEEEIMAENGQEDSREGTAVDFKALLEQLKKRK